MKGFPGSLVVHLSMQEIMRHGFNPLVRKILWRRAWQPTPVFLPGDSPQTEEPGRLQSMGSQRVRHDRSDLAHMHSIEIQNSAGTKVKKSTLFLWKITVY